MSRRMKKTEKNLVLLSSDEEEDCSGRSSGSKRSNSKMKSRSPFPRKSTRQVKKARLLGSRSSLHKDSRNFDEVHIKFFLLLIQASHYYYLRLGFWSVCV